MDGPNTKPSIEMRICPILIGGCMAAGGDIGRRPAVAVQTSAGSSSCDHWQCCAHTSVLLRPVPTHSTTMLDYNEEARKLFATLDGTKPSRFNNLDPIYRSDAGGFIYVGGDLVTQQQPRVPLL